MILEALGILFIVAIIDLPFYLFIVAFIVVAFIDLPFYLFIPVAFIIAAFIDLPFYLFIPVAIVNTSSPSSSPSPSFCSFYYKISCKVITLFW